MKIDTIQPSYELIQDKSESIVRRFYLKRDDVYMNRFK